MFLQPVDSSSRKSDSGLQELGGLQPTLLQEPSSDSVRSVWNVSSSGSGISQKLRYLLACMTTCSGNGWPVWNHGEPTTALELRSSANHGKRPCSQDSNRRHREALQALHGVSPDPALRTVAELQLK